MNQIRKEEYAMEKYVKPIMTVEEMEDVVYTDTATGTTMTTIVSGDTTQKTPYPAGQG